MNTNPETRKQVNMPILPVRFQSFSDVEHFLNESLTLQPTFAYLKDNITPLLHDFLKAFIIKQTDLYSKMKLKNLFSNHQILR